MDRTELREAFAAISTGDIADAMVSAGVLPKTIVGLHAVNPNQKPAAGYARTLKQMVRSNARKDYALAKHGPFIDNVIGPEDVLVIDVDGRLDVCSGGALLVARAKYKGVQGFIVNGCLRDIDDIEKIDIPVYLKAGCPVKSSPLLETVGTDIPVQIGETQVCPGDLIVMDKTGIIVIPIEDAERILEIAQRIQQREDKRMDYVVNGGTVAESLKNIN